MGVGGKQGSLAALACALVQLGASGCALIVSEDPSTDGSEAPLVEDGLILWLRFDDAPAETIVDASGHGRDATCDPGQCPLIGQGVFGGAYVFDGIDDMLRVPDVDGDLETADAFTVAAWARPTDAGYPAPQTIGAKTFGINDVNTWWLGFYAGNVRVHWNAGMRDIAFETGAGNWRHLAVIWNGDELQIAVDGFIVVAELAGFLYDSHGVTIGADSESGGTSDHFLGAVDDFRLYDRALTEGELRTIMGE